MATNNNTNNAPNVTTKFVYLPSDPLGLTATAFASGNSVYVYPITILSRITVAKIVFEITTLHAANFAAVGIYTSDGNTKLIDSGAVSSASTGLKTTTLGTAVTLEPGLYLLAKTASSTTVAVRTKSGENTSLLHNAFTTYAGTAANASASGVLPATLGVITGGSVTPPITLISNE